MSKYFVIGSARALCRTLAGMAFFAAVSAAHADPPASANASPASRLIEFSGKVEITIASTNDWQPAHINQFLHPGDRLRTAADSRATLQLSDRSVIRVGQSSILEIQPPTQPARHRFGLKHGALFFLDREQPADVEFETPLATAAIRGTEFFLEVAEADAATRLALLDGAVDLKAGGGELQLTNGQQALVEPGRPAQLTAVLPAVNLIQWCFYYPAVLNPAEIPFTDAERAALAKSLSDYAGGDLLQALADVPGGLTAQSPATRTYFAALKLAVGQVGEAEDLIAPAGEVAAPLRELIAAVKFQAVAPLPEPTNSSGWLARSYYLQSRSQLPAALNAAQQSVKLAPEFGFAWARVAELEFDFEHLRAARDALNRARLRSTARCPVPGSAGRWRKCNWAGTTKRAAIFKLPPPWSRNAGCSMATWARRGANWAKTSSPKKILRSRNNLIPLIQQRGFTPRCIVSRRIRSTMPFAIWNTRLN